MRSREKLQGQDGDFPVGYHDEELCLAIQVQNPCCSVNEEARSDFFRDYATDRSLPREAFQAVNTTLIDLYWEIGATISRKIEAAEWVDGVVEQLADYIGQTQSGLRGFTRANLFRMRQFYETYNGDKEVAPLVRQLPWSHHLIILGHPKSGSSACG